MKRIVFCISLAFLVLSGCARSVRDLDLLEDVKAHDCVVRAKVIEVGDPPGFWSGIFVAVQEVKYEVVEIYKGQDLIGAKQIRVRHVLVGGAPTEDDDDHPRLVPTLFKPGVEVVLFLRKNYTDDVPEGLYVGGDKKSADVLFVRDGNLVTK